MIKYEGDAKIPANNPLASGGRITLSSIVQSKLVGDNHKGIKYFMETDAYLDAAAEKFAEIHKKKKNQEAGKEVLFTSEEVYIISNYPLTPEGYTRFANDMEEFHNSKLKREFFNAFVSDVGDTD
jgi:hypothetical protein